MHREPLREMHRKLFFLLNQKNQEISNSLDTTNRLTNMSLIQLRAKDVEAFKNAIEHVQPYTDFIPGFTRNFEEIKNGIENIKP